MTAVAGPDGDDQTGLAETRHGNRSANNAPRNTYQTAEGSWVAVSTSAQRIAERVMTLVGHPEIIDEPWFGTGRGRAEHADLLDAAVGEWIAARAGPRSWPGSRPPARRWLPCTARRHRVGSAHPADGDAD